MRLLVIDRGTRLGSPEGHQAIPFQTYREELSRRLGVIVDQVTCMELDEIKQAVHSRPADVVVIMMSWKVGPVEAAEFLQELRTAPGRPRIVFMDYLAPAGSPFLSVIPHVDCYVKRQHLADLGLYSRDYEGGQIFTDFLVKELGYDLDGWYFGTKPDPAHLDKLVTGWNLGVTPRYHKQLKATRKLRPLWKLRPFDVHRRFSPASDGKKVEWYERYRAETARKLDGLAGRYRLTGAGRIHHRLYLAELMASKLVVSPFGWGEVCFRDYEAVAIGALLVKPSMDHLVTTPDIYRPNETYAPVRWDLGDLEETCDYYLRHPSESLRIIRNAQEALLDYCENGGFVDAVSRFLEVANRTPAEGSPLPGAVTGPEQEGPSTTG